MEYTDLAEVEGRPLRYWYLDGIPDLVLGAVWILWGVAFLIPNYLPKGSWLGIYWSIVPAILVASGVAANWLTKKLKTKYTFPRAGYVEFNEPSRSQLLTGILLACLIAAALAGVIALARTHDIADLSAPGLGALMAGAFLVVSKRRRLRHWVWLSAAALVLGLALYPLKLGWMGMQWVLVVIGTASVVVGALRLRAFLKTVPPAGRDEP